MKEYMSSDDDKQHFFLNQEQGEKGFIDVTRKMRLEFKVNSGFFALLSCGLVCCKLKKKDGLCFYLPQRVGVDDLLIQVRSLPA